jgi:hypothetical protein
MSGSNGPDVTDAGAVDIQPSGMTIQAYVSLITAANGTIDMMDTFNPGSRITRQTELAPYMENLNRALTEETGSFPPPMTAVMGPKSVSAFRIILNFIEREELLDREDIDQARASIGG